ncbi:MAG TPA: hypothetical protein VKD65_07700 [Candidatus Angelobacter sp.]|nr:hypothetical protein [Candidatus Angelobacter sp.]
MPSEKTPFEDFGRKLDRGLGEAAKRMEQEGEKLIAYLNDEVVPSIRNNSSKALRVAAEKLSQLANYMEQKNSR